MHSSEVEGHKKRFLAAVNNDLYMPQALAVVWQLVKSQKLKVKSKRELILDWDRVLGLNLGKVEQVGQVEKVDREVKKLVEEREKLRKENKWEEADEARKKIEKMGWGVEDRPEGPKVKKA